jgi:outer membrane protein G
MKKILIIATIFTLNTVFGQAFKGKEDLKLQIGAALMDGGSGLNFSLDKGLGDNISAGISTSYLLGVTEVAGLEADALDRFDIKGRFNIHLSDIIKLGDHFDVYPGINLGIKNLGLHTGVRYFLNNGLGLYTEFDFPISKFEKNITYQYFNAFKVHIGVSLNL